MAQHNKKIRMLIDITPECNNVIKAKAFASGLSRKKYVENHMQSIADREIKKQIELYEKAPKQRTVKK